MTDESIQKLLRHYFIACFLVLTTAVLALTRSQMFGAGAVWIIGVVVLGMAVALYMQTRQRPDQESSEPRIPKVRLRKMAVLWYVLSAILAAPFIKDLVNEWQTADAKKWSLCVFGLAVIVFAVFQTIGAIRKS